MTHLSHDTTADDAIIAQALRILETRARYAENIPLSSPDAARDYCRLRLAGLPHEVFGVLWLDVRIPRPTGHGFHEDLDSDSMNIWTGIPRRTGHRFHGELDRVG